MISVNYVNRFIFSRPEILAVVGASDYANYPLFPVNEVVESESPYTIYTWRTDKVFPYEMINLDTITYSIWDHNVGRLQDLEAQIRRYTGQLDVSAEAFRLWVVNYAAANGAGRTPIIVQHMRYRGTTDVFPQAEDRGVVGKNITFAVQYMDCSNDELSSAV